jgi:hypothetical protein
MKTKTARCAEPKASKVAQEKEKGAGAGGEDMAKDAK